jgi:hypothetical protein
MATIRDALSEISLPTKFEGIWEFARMSELAQEIDKAIQGTDVALSIKPLLGTLPHGSINASTILVPPDDEFLIVFEPELFMFALLISKLVAIPIATILSLGDGWENKYNEFCTNNEILKKTVLENSFTPRFFKDLLYACVFNGTSSSAAAYRSEGLHKELASQLLDAMELFVMAHEYGHIVDWQHQIERQEFEGDTKELLVHMWAQEFSADHIGQNILFRVSALREEKVEFGISFAGTDLFFSSLDILERSIGILRTGNEAKRPVPKQPPVWTRRKMLRDNYTKELFPYTTYDVTALGRVIERILETLWMEIKPELLELYTEGRKLSPIWYFYDLMSIENFLNEK